MVAIYPSLRENVWEQKMAATTLEARVAENAYDAVCLGRALATTWSDAPVGFTAALDGRIGATLTRFADGDVFQRSDDLTITLMVSAIRQTLDSFSPGYGNYWLSEGTAEHPFIERDQEEVRKLGERLKSFIKARNLVINAILAERQLQLLRRR